MIGKLANEFADLISAFGQIGLPNIFARLIPLTTESSDQRKRLIALRDQLLAVVEERGSLTQAQGKIIAYMCGLVVEGRGDIRRHVPSISTMIMICLNHNRLSRAERRASSTE